MAHGSGGRGGHQMHTHNVLDLVRRGGSSSSMPRSDGFEIPKPPRKANVYAAFTRQKSREVLVSGLICLKLVLAEPSQDRSRERERMRGVALGLGTSA